MTRYHLAQLNIGQMIYNTEAAEMADFMANLEKFNALAEASPGFVWRLQTEDGDATGIKYFGDDHIVNMSVWEDVASLFDYTYRSDHAKIMGRRREWFHRPQKPKTVLWWIEAGHLPTLEEAKRKLEHLQIHGPTPEAFTFKKAFPPANTPTQASPTQFQDLCPAN